MYKQSQEVRHSLLMVDEEQLNKVVRQVLNEAMATAKEEERIAKEEATLTRKEVEGILKVNKGTLWRWEKEGYLCPRRVGRRLLYFKSDVDNLLQKGGRA